MYTFAGFLKRGGGLDLKNTFDQYGRPDRPKYEHKTDTMFAKRTTTRHTTEYGSSKRKGWTGVCGLNPSTFRNTTDRNSIKKIVLLIYLSSAIVARHTSLQPNGQCLQSFNDMYLHEGGGDREGGWVSEVSFFVYQFQTPRVE